MLRREDASHMAKEKKVEQITDMEVDFAQWFTDVCTKAELVDYSGIKRISKPGLRVYAGKEELPRVLGGLGIAIISTNQGVITDKKARELQVGGEVLAYIW